MELLISHITDVLPPNSVIEQMEWGAKVNIGNRIKSFRIAKGFAWVGLADKSGVPGDYTCILEIRAANNSSREVLERLVKGFQVLVGDLLLSCPKAFTGVPERATA